MLERRSRRRSGLLLPLFACPTSTSWGIGDIGSIAPITAWLSGAGQRVLQLLPLSEMAADEQSPYSALSAMAIDPLYIDMGAVADFVALGGEEALERADRTELDRIRREPRVAYASARRLKRRALAVSFDRFLEAEWRHGTTRATELGSFIAREREWLDDYALFRTLHAEHGERPWSTWPAPFRQRDPSALEQARQAFAARILSYQYLQWIAAAQWRRAHAIAQDHRVALAGDLPFMVDADSADVWARQEEFDLESSVGVPPDAFSATGQDWGMPAYRWDRIDAQGFSWLQGRARRLAELFDLYRIDHVVGFYRTFSRPRGGGSSAFTPAAEAEQLALGENVLRIFRDAGADIIAEDLGTVPDFVRASLERLGVPGLRVFRWQRWWESPERPFRDPLDYPAVSVAISGTHDTETLAVWWEQSSHEDRRLVGRVPTVARLADGRDLAQQPFDPIVRDVLVETLMASGADLVLFPVQDVFGWRDRINEPATVSPANWTFRLPWPADRLHEASEAADRQMVLRGWASRHNRV